MIKSFRWHILEMKILGSVLKFSFVLAQFSNAVVWIYTKRCQTSHVDASFTLHIEIGSARFFCKF